MMMRWLWKREYVWLCSANWTTNYVAWQNTYILEINTKIGLSLIQLVDLIFCTVPLSKEKLSKYLRKEETEIGFDTMRIISWRAATLILSVCAIQFRKHQRRLRRSQHNVRDIQRNTAISIAPNRRMNRIITLFGWLLGMTYFATQQRRLIIVTPPAQFVPSNGDHD